MADENPLDPSPLLPMRLPPPLAPAEWVPPRPRPTPPPGCGYLCQQCLSFARGRRKTRGSFLMEVVLWLLFCVPGFIYSIWRVTTRYKVCEICQSTALIPVSTPAAQELLSRIHR